MAPFARLLGLPPYGKQEWKRVAPDLHRRNLLNEEVQAVLASYCSAAGTVRQCEEILNADGRIISSESGPVQHPAFKIQMAAMRELRLYACELAITPHRRGTKGEEKEQGNGWDPDLLA